MTTKQTYLIGVVGMTKQANGDPVPPSILSQAEAVGQEIANQGNILVTGGEPGGGETVKDKAMDGAAATSATARLISLLPSRAPRCTQRSMHHLILNTGMGGNQRNPMTGGLPDALIVLKGGAGTFSECAYALRKGKPVVFLDSWGSLDERFFLDGFGEDRNVESVLAEALLLNEAQTLAESLQAFFTTAPDPRFCVDSPQGAVDAVLNLLNSASPLPHKLTVLVTDFSSSGIPTDATSYPARIKYESLANHAEEFDMKVNQLLNL